MSNPICRACTRSGRTVDTPNIKVRVERFLLWRDGASYRFVARCHHAVLMGSINVEGLRDEDDLARLEVFGG